MSLAKRIIPCLDVHAGRVVKGVNFVNLQVAGDPVEAAQAYDEAGADELVFQDISATLEERAILLEVVVGVGLAVGGEVEEALHPDLGQALDLGGQGVEEPVQEAGVLAGRGGHLVDLAVQKLQAGLGVEAGQGQNLLHPEPVPHHRGHYRPLFPRASGC